MTPKRNKAFRRYKSPNCYVSAGMGWACVSLSETSALGLGFNMPALRNKTNKLASLSVLSKAFTS